MKFEAGNIWSGSKNGIAVLTNPTEIAFRKGNLKSHYPVMYNGKIYADSEALYHKLSVNCKADNERCYEFCTVAIICKLNQYPRIVKAIEDSGGVAFLKKCSHKVYGKCARWEGNGLDSGFIRCLIKAYEAVTII